MARRLVIAASSGLLAALAFPRPGLWPLSFVAWVPLLLALRGVTARQGTGLGIAAGLLFFATTLRWLAELTPAGWIALVVYLALYPALFAATAAWLLARGGGLGVPCAWVAAEWLRGWVLTGFGWASLGYALAPQPRLIQAASLGGVLLLSFAIMASNHGLACAWIAARARRPRRAGAIVAATLAIPAALWFSGTWMLAPDARPDWTLRIALVQDDLPPGVKSAPGGALLSVQRHVELTQAALAARPDLIVWPETAVPRAIDSEALPILAPFLRARVREWHTPLLFGAPELARADPETYWNTAILLRPDDVRVPAYRKRRLVPFGEFTPWRDRLPFLPRPIVGDEFVPGDGGPPFEVHGVRLLPLICYEDLFADEALTRAGEADVLVAISNDGWFASRSAAEQHVQISILRAVETGRAVARAASTGVSALIDPRGRVRAAAPAGASYTAAAVPVSRAATVFSRAPHAPAALALAGLLMALLSAARASSVPATAVAPLASARESG